MDNIKVECKVTLYELVNKLFESHLCEWPKKKKHHLK